MEHSVCCVHRVRLGVADLGAVRLLRHSSALGSAIVAQLNPDSAVDSDKSTAQTAADKEADISTDTGMALTARTSKRMPLVGERLMGAAILGAPTILARLSGVSAASNFRSVRVRSTASAEYDSDWDATGSTIFRRATCHSRSEWKFSRENTSLRIRPVVLVSRLMFLPVALRFALNTLLVLVGQPGPEPSDDFWMLVAVHWFLAAGFVGIFLIALVKRAA